MSKSAVYRAYNPLTASPRSDDHNILAASLSPCHQDFLQTLQVQANLIVPINMGTQLWGLLIAHECAASPPLKFGVADLKYELARA